MDIDIRHAGRDDAEAVLRMVKSFYSVSGYEKHIPLDDETCMGLINLSIDLGLCSVADNGQVVGFVMGITAPAIMNKNYLIGCELAWWVDPEYRGKVGTRLLKHIENSAQEMGLKMWSMVALESQNPEMVEKIYLNSGYEKTEMTYTRFN